MGNCCICDAECDPEAVVNLECFYAVCAKCYPHPTISHSVGMCTACMDEYDVGYWYIKSRLDEKQCLKGQIEEIVKLKQFLQ